MSRRKEIPALLAFLVKVREERKRISSMNDSSPDRREEILDVSVARREIAFRRDSP
jgi:hypothetical protein